MVSRPDKDGIGHVAGKRGTWAWLALGHRLCFWPWFPGMLLGVGNVSLEAFGPDPRKVDTSGVSYAALVSVAEFSASKTSGAERLHQECRRRVL